MMLQNLEDELEKLQNAEKLTQENFMAQRKKYVMINNKKNYGLVFFKNMDKAYDMLIEADERFARIDALPKE